MGAGECRGSDDAIDRRAGFGERDVVANRPVKENVLLQNNAQLPTQPGAVHHGEIDAVDEHSAAFGNVEPLYEFGERTCSAPGGRTDNANNLPGGNAGSSHRAILSGPSMR